MGNNPPYPGVSIVKEPLFDYVPACDEFDTSRDMYAQSRETLLFHFHNEKDDDFQRGVMILLEHIDQGSFDMLRQYTLPQLQDTPYNNQLMVEAHCIDIYARRRVLADLSHYEPRNVIKYSRQRYAKTSSDSNSVHTHSSSGICCNNTSHNDNQEFEREHSGSSSSSLATRSNAPNAPRVINNMEGQITVMPRADTYNRYYVLPLYDLPMMAPSMARAEIEKQAKISNNVLCDVVFGLMSIGYLYNGTATIIFHQPFPPVSFKLFGKRYSPRLFDNHIYDHYCRVCKQLNGHDTQDCPPKFNEYNEYDDEEDSDQYMTETSSTV
ncbi:hypothetical protein K492DRAFT_195928 [Lichtheimia hyalospora FSU 10163]|nr:hypothetical protein K492DRAFT_195928 [Lichtheimia hyalospora FSU 10163]